MVWSIKYIVICSLITAGVFTIQAIVIGQKSEQSLISGSSWVGKRWPWVVRLHFDNKSDTRCAGALISTDLVLTAAHCVKKLTVIVGDVRLYHLDRHELRIEVNNIVIHPFSNSRKIYADEFSADELSDVFEYDVNDIALLHLSRAINCSKRVHPIQLPWIHVHGVYTDHFPPPKPLAKYKRCYVAGYGKVNFNGAYPDHLRSIKVQLIGHDRCSNRQFYGNLIRPGMICAGDELGGWNSDACTGDSGGPLMCRSLNGVWGRRWGPWQLVGLVSWGYKCATENKPGVYTDVGVYNYWIQSEINQKRALVGNFLNSQKFCDMR